MYHRIMRSISLAVFVIIALMSSLVNAQDKKYACERVVELSGTVSYSTYTPVSNGQSGTSTSIMTIVPQIGVFVSDGLELSLSTGFSLLPGISIISQPNSESITMVELFFAPSYNFRTASETLFPFLEAQIGYTSLSGEFYTQSGLSYGGRGGLKIVVADHLLLTMSAQNLAITLNSSGSMNRSDFNYLTIGIGVGGFL
jgi:hypothetical protein